MPKDWDAQQPPRPTPTPKPEPAPIAYTGPARSLYPCPTCGATFGRELAHCDICGYHGPHECSGESTEARQARAAAFIRQARKSYQTWADVVYSHKDKSDAI